jgi:hypothetical protein
MPYISRFVLAVLLASIAHSACHAQGKGACDLISQADAESVTGVTLRLMPGPDRSRCIFMGSRSGPRGAIRVQAILDVHYSGSPDPQIVNRKRNEFATVPSLQHVVLREVPDVGDAALWNYTNQDAGTGTLIAYKGGTMELYITVIGIADDAALAGAKKLSVRALGGTGKTGYAYATSPRNNSAKCNPADDPIARCETAAAAFESTAKPESPKDPGNLIGPLSQARSEFLANPASLPAQQKLLLHLDAVDFTYLTVAMYGQKAGTRDSDPKMKANVLALMAGVLPVDAVIPASTRSAFDIWVSAVSDRLPASELLNSRSKLSQALKDTEPQYQRYVALRDQVELCNPRLSLQFRKSWCRQ